MPSKLRCTVISTTVMCTSVQTILVLSVAAQCYQAILLEELSIGAELVNMSDIDTSTVINTSTTGDHDKFAHYVEKEEITRAFVEGVPVIALCGKIWVPSRAPDDFQVCPSCKEMYSQLSEAGHDRV